MNPGLLVVLGLGALVNGATFCTFTYLAPVVTDVAGLGVLWVPVAFVSGSDGVKHLRQFWTDSHSSS